MSDERNESMHHIIRLKQYEQPPEGYFDEFVRDFQHRQRAELLKPSLSVLLWERFCSLIPDVRVPAMAYAGVVAVAVVAAVAIVRTPSIPAGNPLSSYAVSYTQPPVTIPNMQPVSLRVNLPQVPQSPNQLFPPSFLLQARPASHESPLRF